MAWDYTIDDVRQTQAYLLSEVDRITGALRQNQGGVRTGNVHGNVIAPVVVTAMDSPNVIQKIASRKDSFVDLPDEFLNSLQPEIKVYKTFISEETGEEYNYLLPMGTFLARVGNEKQATQGVVVKSAEFTRLGGNPAEINTNIKFNIKLFAKDVSTFFTKIELPPIEKYQRTPLELAQAVVINEQIEEDIQRVSDLRSARYERELTEDEQLFLRVQSRRNSSPLDATANTEEFRTKLDELANSVSHIGPNGERKVAWIDLIKINPGQPLNSVRDDALVAKEKDVRIKVEVGYAEVTAKPRGYSGTEEDFNRWKSIIESQRETFHLSLLKHQFDFKGYDGIDLSIDFIATGNAKQLSPEADLFHDAQAEELIQIMQILIDTNESEIDAANNIETQTEVISDCITALENEINEAEKAILEYRSTTKLRILNQLYLDSTSTDGRYSRVFERKYDRPDTEGEESISAKRQRSPSYNYIGDLSVISDNDLPDAETNYSRRGIQNIDLDASTAEGEVGITREQYEGGRNSDLFIFLGDIIESAIEILVPGKNELGVAYTTTYTGNANTVRKVVTGAATVVGAVVTVATGGTAGVLIAGTTMGLSELATRLKTKTASSERGASEFSFRPPFCWNDGGAAAIEVQLDRLNTALKEFGGILTGTVGYTDPNRTKSGNIKTVKIRDIPIALDIFRSWWINTYVKSGKKSLHLRDFIVALMKFVEKEVFEGTPLDFGRQEQRVDDPRFIVNGISVSDTTFNRVMYKSTGNTFRNIRESAVFEAYPGDHGNDVLTIESVPLNPIKTSDVPNLIFGDTDKGILKKINFERSDIPGHAEARLFSDRSSTASNLALREKYNTSLDMLGNTCFLPGSLLYIDPLPLDMGYTDEKESLARQLGLGGMYSVHSLTSVMSFDSSGNSWYTKVKTKWESFGDGDTGASAIANPTLEELGLCNQAAIRERVEAARIAADDPQFYERQAELQSSAFYVDPAEGQRAEDVVPLGGGSIMVPE